MRISIVHSAVSMIALASIAILSPIAAGSPAHAQITSFDEAALHVVMTGPGHNTGECSGMVDPQSGVLALTCTHDVTGGRTVITRGRPGEGVTIFDLGTGAIVADDLSLSDTEVAALLTGDLWVAVTSAANPNGEVSARLLPQTPTGEQVMRFPLTNEDMVRTASAASGTCALRIRAGSGPITLLCVHDVPDAMTLRLQIDGGVVRTSSGVESPFEMNMPELRANFARFLDWDYGVVLTSGAFPEGELGRVLADCIEGPTTLCLNDNRFRVSVRFTAPGKATADGRGVPQRSGDSGLFWFFSPANWEVLVKVLNPCGQRQHFWVFLSANTNVAFEATVFDGLTGRTRVYSNPQGHVADTVADTTAFPCT